MRFIPGKCSTWLWLLFVALWTEFLGTAEGGGFWESVVQVATRWFECEAVGMRMSTFKSDAVVVSY